MTNHQTITATARAEEINALTVARAEAQGLGLYGLLVTDPVHWAEYGVHTGADLDHYLAYSDYVETYKEVRNIKPRWMRISDHTVEEFEAMTADLRAEAEGIARREREEEARYAELTACEPLRVKFPAFDLPAR